MPKYTILCPHDQGFSRRAVFNTGKNSPPEEAEEIMRGYKAEWAGTLSAGSYWLVDCSAEDLLLLLLSNTVRLINSG